MGKKTDSSDHATPILVVFGLDDKGQTRAGTFFEIDFEPARKAASLLKLHSFESTADMLRPALKNIGEGQAFASGWAIIPRVRRNHYDTLLSIIASVRPTASVEASNVLFPASWDDIQKDSLVLAQADSADLGWWPSIVEKIEGQMLTVRWQDFPRDPKARRHISAVALIRPPVASKVGD
jgi:hypothetical protein